MAERMLPRITVVMPSYNQAAFLRQAIRSVLCQDYPNLQFLVVDGGSTDSSVAVIREFAPRIDRWVSEPDEGQSDALNKGLSWAEGEVVTWLNSDDLLMPGALHTAGRMWRRYPDLHLLSGECLRIGPNNEFLGWHVVPRQTRWFARHGLIYIDQPGAFWKRGLLPAPVVDRKLTMFMDADLWCRVTLLGGRTLRVRKGLAAFRLQPASKTCTIYDACRNEQIGLWRKYCPGTEKIAFSTTAAYRLWKCANGDYLRQTLLTHWPPAGVREYLREIRRSSESAGIGARA